MTSSFLRVALLIVLFIAAERALAIPRFSLISGTRCSACHFTPHGGGIRTELGWGSMNEVGLFRWPWQPPKPATGGDGADDDLFTTPSDGATEETAPETVPDAVPVESDVPPETTDAPPPADEPVADAPADDAPTDEASMHTNSLFDGLITPGVDIRLQVAKIGRPPRDERRLLPMQTQLYLAVTPVEWLALFSGYNYSTEHYRFPGQSGWEATAQFHPSVSLPTLRVGYMQPSIGIRHDDHTSFTRRAVAGTFSQNLVPPGYAELGAEISYEGISWLTVNAGVFGSSNLAEIVPELGEITEITDFSKPSLLGRIKLWPQDLDLGFNGELGASIFANGDSLTMINVFAGIGLSDRSSFLVEAFLATLPDNRRVRNVSVMGSYQLFQWLSLDWRYEFGQTERPDADPTKAELGHAHQAVFGLEFFPLPYLEIRPEYRFFQLEPFGEIGGFQQGQYTVQMHVFY
jgi:hypothetical protein